MKTRNNISGLLVALICACLVQACAVDRTADGGKDAPIGTDILVCGMWEGLSVADSSAAGKTVMASGNTPVWSGGDEISVLTADGQNSRFVLKSGEGTETGTFQGTLPSSGNYCALYPYNENSMISSGEIRFSTGAEQNGMAGSFSRNGNVMVASFSRQSPELRFRNVFGLLGIQLSGTAKVGRITITGSEGDALCGDFSLAFDGTQGTDSQSLSAISGSNTASLVFTPAVQLSEGAATLFYFALPAGSLSEGFTLTVYDEEGHDVKVKSTGKAQTIRRSAIRLMETVADVNRAPETDIKPEPFTWAAYNSLKRPDVADATIIDPQSSQYPSKKSDKYVGIFYFIWHSSWSAAGRVPHDNQAQLGDGNYNYVTGWNPSSCWCSPCGYPHHWGRSYMDYYRDDDLWVLRKHAQMLSDAGVDFIAFDVTNNQFYISEVQTLLNLFAEMREEGYKTPQITFMIWHSGKNNTTPSDVRLMDHYDAVKTLYDNLYNNAQNRERWNDLWFKWEGKPLMLALGNTVADDDPALASKFTFRACWYLWNNNWQTNNPEEGKDDKGDPWWGDGKGKWPWGVCYTDNTSNPMRAGLDNSGNTEFCSVSPATHPVSNIGRSFQIGNNWQSYKNHPGEPDYPKDPSKGIYFKQQFEAAYALDPEIMFFTGWNEYLVGHNQAPTNLQFPYMGGKVADWIFVDQYNNEFSRDIEPISGDFGDNYYYYMVDFIRRFKGVDNVPVYSKASEISIDGSFSDWFQVTSCYADDKEDNKWRGYNVSATGNNGAYGFNTNDIYRNETGRNDLRVSKVATDGTKLYFYIDAAESFTAQGRGIAGLRLLIGTGASSTWTGADNWEGFNYIIEPQNATTATLSSCSGEGGLVKQAVASEIRTAVTGNALELEVPLSSLGITNANSFSIDFKWVDNVDLTQGDGIQRCMRDGDSAPNGRFRYRYVYNKNYIR